MNAASQMDTSARQQRTFTLAMLAVCAVGGAGVAVITGVSPLAGVGLVMAGVAGVAVVWVLGLTGALIIGAVTFAFLLMNRFDEGLAIPMGHDVAVKATYLSTGLFVGMLAILVHWRRSMAGPESSPRTHHAGLFFRLWLLFLLIALAGLVVNHLFDQHITTRFLPGEILALIGILLPMAMGFLIPLCGLSEMRTKLCIRGVVALGGLAGLIMALFGLLPDQIIGALGWSGATGGTSDLVRGRLPLGHPNQVAAVMVMVMPVATIQGLGGRSWFWRFFYLGCAGLMFCGVLFSLSRAALLNLSLILALSLVYLAFAKENRSLFRIALAAGFGMLLVGVMAFLFMNYDFSRFWSRGYFEDASVERRKESMETSLVVFRDHRLLGAGADSVYERRELRPDYAPRLEDRISPIIIYKGHVTAETPHNFYLTLLAEYGIAGTPVFLGVLVLVVLALWRARGHPGIDLYEKRKLTALFLGVCAFLVSGMFEAILMVGLRPSVVFWAFAGLALHYSFTVSERRKISENAA